MVIRLSTGFVVGNRNLGLNIIFSVCVGFMWCVIASLNLRYLEVVLLTEQLQMRRANILIGAQIGFRAFMLIAFPVHFISFIVPVVSAIEFIPMLWIVSLINLFLMSTLLLYYGFRVRVLLNSMQVSKTFYRKLRQRLDVFLIPTSFMFASGICALFIFIFVPLFSRNQYILFGLLNFLSQCTASLTLYTIRTPDEDETNDAEMTGKTTMEYDGSRHSYVGRTVEIPSSDPVLIPFTPQVETPREQTNIDQIEIQLLTPTSSPQMSPSSSTPSHNQSERNDKSGIEQNHGENNDLLETSLSSYEKQLLQAPLTEESPNKEYDKKESWNVP